ncbi:MAG: zinc ribbon domain-containing protein [Pseudomonadota bacterium]
MVAEETTMEMHPACIACGEPVNAGARLCHHCGAQQRQGWSGKKILTVCAGLTTVLSLVFALQQGYRIWAGYRHGDEQLQKQLIAAQAFKDVRDYAAAWEVLTLVQSDSPGSSELRTAQIQVAYDWLIKGYSPKTGWIPGTSGKAPAPTVTPGEAANRVHSPLVVARVNAEGAERAKLEALVAWANLLRGRELHTSRRDLGSDFRRARDMAPQAFTPNLLLGHWEAAFANNPEAAMQSWGQALAANRDRSLVRRFQVNDLGAAIEKDNGADDYRRALLLLLNDMERRRESFPAGLRLRAFRGLYVDSQFRRLHFESVSTMLEPERQLAVLEWARHGFRIEPKRYETHFETFQLIRAYLLEQAGRTDDAVAALLDPGVQIKHSDRLVARFDEAYERLTGRPREPDPERDEWGAYAYYLEHSMPGEARFDTAMAALKEWETTWNQVGDSLINGKLPPALDAAVAAWERELARADIGEERLREAQQNLRFLHYFRGHVRADSYDFLGGIAELEAVVADSGTPQSVRAETLFALAAVYTYSPPAPSPDNKYQWQIYQAYLYEGLDRLAAAVEAGFDDWDRIENDLPRLRDLSEYEPFSLRHGRVPRNQLE